MIRCIVVMKQIIVNGLLICLPLKKKFWFSTSQLHPPQLRKTIWQNERKNPASFSFVLFAILCLMYFLQISLSKTGGYVCHAIFKMALFIVFMLCNLISQTTEYERGYTVEQRKIRGLELRERKLASWFYRYRQGSAVLRVIRVVYCYKKY